MIRVNQVKLPIDHKEEELAIAVAKALKVKKEEVRELLIKKRSIDARKRNEIKYIYAVDVKMKNEERVVARAKNPNVTISKEKEYRVIITGEQSMKHRPIVVGSGPAGLFCAYQLAFYGYRPILIERGAPVEERVKDVDTFWETNVLNPESNVQFGEGGAGTFSDGKLNTMVKDTFGRIRKVLEIFVEHGANEEILYLNKPHIGTDHLREVTKNMRQDIIARGGEVMFHTKLVDIRTEDGAISEVVLEQLKEKKTISLPCSDLILAIGHSARDTFEMLYKNKLPMEKKAFAVGVRMEHKQDMISRNQYGEAYQKLPAADYKVTYQASTGRAVYSFCMCPGGYVVNASSEEGRLVVNGMSYHDRAGENANSAIIVTVGEKDFLSIPGAVDSPLCGMEFQRYFEALAYQTGRGKVPVQTFKDFKEKKKTTELGEVKPNLKGGYEFAELHECLPAKVSDTIVEGVLAFDKMIPGFANPDALLSGVEMRTSSPVRMNRDEHLESEIKGIYPCGEGAGYAGGITSAAVDGLKVFEVLAARYSNL
ncbi:MAG: FAD-dependent oxidoreductase [Clostridiales bacterium]|nr:FAD-dependent oxidoreductase [Clostridiales bacterium]